MVIKLRGFFIDCDIDSPELLTKNHTKKRNPVYFTRILKGVRWNRKGFITHMFKKHER